MRRDLHPVRVGVTCRQCVDHQSRHRTDTEFLHDVAAMGNHRRQPDAETVGDLLVDEPPGDERQHFGFALRERLPGLRAAIEQTYAATPLTYRHYTGIPHGAAYGLQKDCRNVMATCIPVRTKFENLLLTGQNLTVHGAIGVTLSAAATCAELLGTEYLAKKIGDA